MANGPLMRVAAVPFVLAGKDGVNHGSFWLARRTAGPAPPQIMRSNGCTRVVGEADVSFEVAVATKTARKPAPARGSGKPASGRARAAWPAGGARSRRRPPWRVTLHSMVEDQSDDLWGLAFLLVAVLAGLGHLRPGHRPRRPCVADRDGRRVGPGPVRPTGRRSPSSAGT